MMSYRKVFCGHSQKQTFDTMHARDGAFEFHAQPIVDEGVDVVDKVLEVAAGGRTPDPQLHRHREVLDLRVLGDGQPDLFGVLLQDDSSLPVYDGYIVGYQETHYQTTEEAQWHELE